MTAEPRSSGRKSPIGHSAALQFGRNWHIATARQVAITVAIGVRADISRATKTTLLTNHVISPRSFAVVHNGAVLQRPSAAMVVLPKADLVVTRADGKRMGSNDMLPRAQQCYNQKRVKSKKTAGFSALACSCVLLREAVLFFRKTGVHFSGSCSKIRRTTARRRGGERWRDGASTVNGGGFCKPHVPRRRSARSLSRSERSRRRAHSTSTRGAAATRRRRRRPTF